MAKSRFAPTFLSLCGLLYLAAQFTLAQDIGPVQAELVQRLDASRVKIGDSILGKVEVAWKGANCDLRSGAIVQGHVVAQKAHSKAEKISQIGVAFESGQCNGREMQPLFLTIAAIVAPTRDDADELGVEHLQALGSAVGVTIGSTSGGMRSVSQAADTVFYQPRPQKIPDKLKPGQVVGIPHLAIAVGEGDGGASLLYSTGQNVQLSPGTTFVLVPNLKAGTAAANATASPETAATDAEHSSPPASSKTASPEYSFELGNETAVCIAPECSIVPAEAPSDEETHGAQMTLPLAGLGYLPPAPNREMASFAYDAGIAYLGPNQLLFTFNPHTLVPRSGDEATLFHKLHLVRAVLMDLEKREVIKTVDWRVPDSGQYLWPIGKDRVLVHIGQELRLYGPGLKMIDQVFLGGQLAFVRVSPSSEYFAAGVIHERHTREIHRQLEDAELREPEEDVEIRLFDSQFKVLSTVTRSSRIAPPILMNEGEVDVFSTGRHRGESGRPVGRDNGVYSLSLPQPASLKATAYPATYCMCLAAIAKPETSGTAFCTATASSC